MFFLIFEGEGEVGEEIERTDLHSPSKIKKNMCLITSVDCNCLIIRKCEYDLELD